MGTGVLMTMMGVYMKYIETMKMIILNSDSDVHALIKLWLMEDKRCLMSYTQKIL